MGAGENKYCGALLNFDLSPNPAFKVIDKLINEEWRTEGIYGTNEYGVANINGFKGDYDLEFSYNGKIIPSQSNLMVVMIVLIKLHLNKIEQNR